MPSNAPGLRNVTRRPLWDRAALLLSIAIIFYLAAALIEVVSRLVAEKPLDAEFFSALAGHTVSEVAAAVVAGLVAVLLIDARSRRELEEAVDRRLSAGVAGLSSLQTQIRDEMQAAGMCYRMFGHAGDDAVIRNVNQRILEKPILRRSHEIICTFRERGAGSDAWLEMTCNCKVKYDNLSRQPQYQGFSLVLDRLRVFSEAPLQSLRLTQLDDRGNDAGSVEIDLRRDMVEDGAGAFYAIRDRREGGDGQANAAFVIPGGKSVLYEYEYAMRQPTIGREDFCLLGVTGKMSVRALSEHPRKLALRLEPQTDLPSKAATSVTGGLLLEVGPVLLPMQGVVVHWCCET